MLWGVTQRVKKERGSDRWAEGSKESTREFLKDTALRQNWEKGRGGWKLTDVATNLRGPRASITS